MPISWRAGAGPAQEETIAEPGPADKRRMGRFFESLFVPAAIILWRAVVTALGGSGGDWILRSDMMRQAAMAILVATSVLAMWTVGARGQEPTQGEAPGGMGLPMTLAEVQAWTGRHPRLVFGPDEVAALRGRRTVAPYDKILKTLLERAEQHLAIEPRQVGQADFQGRDQMSHILQRLAFAGVVTGEAKYSRKAIDLLVALAERGFPFHGRHEDGAGDLLVGVALAYDWTCEAMTADERTRVKQGLKLFGVRLNGLMAANGGAYGQIARRPGAAGHHAVALGGGGLGLLALALRGELGRDFTNAWQQNADICVHNYFRDAFGADGAGIEGFDLTTYGLHAALPYTLARRRMDRVDLAEGTAVGQAASWYVYELLSGPAMMPLGESGQTLGSEDALAALFAAFPGDAVQAWFYEKTHGSLGRGTYGTAEAAFCSGDVASYLWYPGPTQPADPLKRLPLGQRFPSAGRAFVRSGWADPAGDVVVSFHCPSRAHLGRWQMDVNQFTLYAYNTGWAIDSGPGWQTRDGEPVLSPTGGTAGHNLLEIDGKGGVRPFGRMLLFSDEKDWSLAIGDGSEAMGLKTFRRYLAVGKRDGKARYVVIVDEVDPGDAAEHQVTQFLHTGATNKVSLAGKVAGIVPPGGAAGQFAVIWPRQTKLVLGEFVPLSGPGHPVLRMEHKTAGAFYAVSVLIPGDPAEPKPATITPVYEESGAVAFTVDLGGITDRVCILTGPEARPPEGFGREKHRFQFTNGGFTKSLLFDLEEPGHDVPQGK